MGLKTGVGGGSWEKIVIQLRRCILSRRGWKMEPYEGLGPEHSPAFLHNYFDDLG